MSFSTTSTAAAATPLLSVSCNNLRVQLDPPSFSQQQHQKAAENVDDLQTMWTAFSKCKSYIENGTRLEYMSWRLWHYYQSNKKPQQLNIATILSTTEQRSSVIQLQQHDAFNISHEVSQGLQKCYESTTHLETKQSHHASSINNNSNKQQRRTLLVEESAEQQHQPEQQQPAPILEPTVDTLLSRSSSFCKITVTMDSNVVMPTTGAIEDHITIAIATTMLPSDDTFKQQNTPLLTTTSLSSSDNTLNDSSKKETKEALIQQNDKKHNYDDEEDDDDEDYYLSDEDDDIYEEDDLYDDEDEQDDINYHFVKDFKKTKPRPATPQRSLLSDLLQRSSPPSLLSNSSSSFTTASSSDSTASIIVENKHSLTSSSAYNNNTQLTTKNDTSASTTTAKWRESFHGW